MWGLFNFALFNQMLSSVQGIKCMRINMLKSIGEAIKYNWREKDPIMHTLYRHLIPYRMRCLLIRTRASRETRIRFSSFGVYNPTSLNNCGIEGKKKTQMWKQTILGKRARMKLNSVCLFWVGETVKKEIEFTHTRTTNSCFSLKLILVCPLWTNWTIFSEVLS